MGRGIPPPPLKRFPAPAPLPHAFRGSNGLGHRALFWCRKHRNGTDLDRGFDGDTALQMVHTLGP